mgnify:CR=1 FL=1
MHKMKRLAALLTTALLLSIPLTSMAATGTKISSVSLKIDSDIEAWEDGGDVSVTTSSSKFYVEETEVTNEPSDGWEDRDKPKIKVTLIAEDDYYFPSGFSKSNVNISGSDGTVTSVSRSSSKLTVSITLDALDDDGGGYDLDVSELEWDESDGTASWYECEDAKKYEVRLYRGSSAVTSAITTTDTSYNFSSYITKSGTYTFKVRGVYSSSKKGSWEESDSWYVSSDDAEDISSQSGSPAGTATGAGAWLKDNVGWWYCNADKTYTINNWQYINNYWYYFNGTGYMVTGWINWNSKWYYCGESGAMYANATTPDGYYVGSDGAWIQ